MLWMFENVTSIKCSPIKLNTKQQIFTIPKKNADSEAKAE